MYIFEKLSPHHSQCFHVFIAFTRLSFSFGNGFLLWLNSYMIIYISLIFFFFINLGGVSKKLARIYIREYFAYFLFLEYVLYIHYLHVSIHLSQYHMQKTLSFPVLNVLALVIKLTDELCVDLSLVLCLFHLGYM